MHLKHIVLNVVGSSEAFTATLKDANGNGVANTTVTLNVTGANAGAAGTAVSGSLAVTWLVPAQSISTTTVFAQFFASDGNGTFNTPPSTPPAFVQEFPKINFNPNLVGTGTRPFTDAVTDVNGNVIGTIVAQGNGLQAGVGTLFNFQASFTGTFTVASAGSAVFHFISDDGFVFGICNGVTGSPSNPMFNAPASGLTPFANLRVIGATRARRPSPNTW